MGKKSRQHNNISSLLCLSLWDSFCEVKPRAKSLRSNGPGDEKSRSLRADGEEKGRSTEIREKDKMKANLS